MTEALNEGLRGHFCMYQLAKYLEKTYVTLIR